MEIGIKCKWECPACGNILISSHPFWTKEYRKSVKEPTHCGCGRKGNFTLKDLKKCDFSVVPKGYSVMPVDEDGNPTQTKEEYP